MVQPVREKLALLFGQEATVPFRTSRRGLDNLDDRLVLLRSQQVVHEFGPAILRGIFCRKLAGEIQHVQMNLPDGAALFIESWGQGHQAIASGGGRPEAGGQGDGRSGGEGQEIEQGTEELFRRDFGDETEAFGVQRGMNQDREFVGAGLTNNLFEVPQVDQ